MRGVCVVGPSKTGTTGWYASVREGLRRAECACYGFNERYDEAVYASLRRLAPDVPVVAKLLITNASFSPDLVAFFDKSVFTVRDPRDTLLSVALYYPVRAVNKGTPREDIDRYVDLISRKEQDPESVTFREMLAAVYRLIGRQVDESTSFARRFRLAIRYAKSASPFLVRYESLVEDRMEEVSDYLGFPVTRTRPSEYASTVIRSATAEEWRRWFTKSDVDYFRPMVASYMRYFGYEDDWELAPRPVIDPGYGSEYIRSACEKRRRQRALLRARTDHGDEHLAQLRDRADDGSDSAAYELARRLWDGDRDKHGSEIHYYAALAAACGHGRAMRLLARCLTEGVGTPPDPALARFWQAEAGAEEERRALRRRVDELVAKEERQRRRLAAKERRLREARDALRAIRTSRRYRLASLVASSLNDGPAGVMRLPGRLWRFRREMRGR